MIPNQILEKIDRPVLKAMLLNKLKLYIDVNSVDKVILVGSSIVENFLMEVAMPFFNGPNSQLPEWLTKWWSSGWTRKETGHILPPHKDFVAYATEIINEVYWERKNESP